MEKQKKQKAASNLLSGFAAARKKHGVGTADGPKTTEPTPEVELTQEEKDRQEVRRVMMATSDWQVLNLVPNAQPKWVKQAYRELAKVLHPDKCKAPGAKDAFQKLSKAYQNINAMQA
jgi:DnaJ-domain-containing protein 1